MNAAPTRRPAGRIRIAAVIAIIIAAAGALWAWRSHSAEAPAGKGKNGAPVAVGVSAAVRMDLPLSLSALGTVSANNTSVVKSRVDGQLMKLHFQEGQLVKQGQLLAELDPRPFEATLMQAQGQLARDSALLKNAELDLARYQQLLSQNSIAKQQVDTQQALVEQYRGTVQIDRGAVANARLQLDYSRISAPISGRAGLRQVDLGNIVHASDTNGIVTLTQTQPINIVFAVPETRLDQVLKPYRAGQKLAVEAWDRDGKEKLAAGMLATLDNQLNAATGTVNLKARFENSDERLFPNQFVNVNLATGMLKDAVAVPNAALQQGKPGSYVYIVGGDETVSLRKVEPGPISGEFTAILKGVKPGERVAVDGVDKLRDGQRIKAVDRAQQDKESLQAGKNGKGGKGHKRQASAAA